MSRFLLLGLCLLLNSCADLAEQKPAVTSKPKLNRVTESSNAVVYEPPGNPRVINGAAYECTTLDIPTSVTTLQVSERIQVRTDSKAKDIKIYLIKVMDFMGHPRRLMSVDEVRRDMGIAKRVDGPTLSLACYGVGFSCFEGGYGMNAVVIVPDRLKVSRFHYQPKDRYLSPVGSMKVEPDTSDTLEAMVVDGWHPIQCHPDRSHGFDRFHQEETRSAF